MKSFAKTLYDYRQYPLEKTARIACPQEHIDREFLHVTRRFKKQLPVETAQVGDVTLLKLESALPKFNRPMVPVTVGGGLFSAELEAQLPGHRVGERFTAQVDGQPVTVTIAKASRTEYPEPTDEMVAAYADEHTDYAQVRTVEQYRQRVVADYLEEARRDAIYRPMNEIMDYVLTHSDWEFDPEELAQMEQSMLAEQRAHAQEELGVSLEEMTAEQMTANFGVDSMEAMLREVHKAAEWQIATILWQGICTGADLQALTPETAAWDFSFLEQFVRETVTIQEE